MAVLNHLQNIYLKILSGCTLGSGKTSKISHFMYDYIYVCIKWCTIWEIISSFSSSFSNLVILVVGIFFLYLKVLKSEIHNSQTYGKYMSSLGPTAQYLRVFLSFWSHFCENDPKK